MDASTRSIQSQLRNLAAENERRLEALVSFKPPATIVAVDPEPEVPLQQLKAKRRSTGGRFLKALINFSSSESSKKQPKRDGVPLDPVELSDASELSDFGVEDALPVQSSAWAA